VRQVCCSPLAGTLLITYHGRIVLIGRPATAATIKRRTMEPPAACALLETDKPRIYSVA